MKGMKNDEQVAKEDWGLKRGGVQGGREKGRRMEGRKNVKVVEEESARWWRRKRRERGVTKAVEEEKS